MSLRIPLLWFGLAALIFPACEPNHAATPAPSGDQIGAAISVYEALIAEARRHGVDGQAWYLEFGAGDAPLPWVVELARRHGEVLGYSEWPHEKGSSDYQGAVRLAIHSLDELGRYGWSGECTLEMGSLNAYGLEVHVEWDGAAWEATQLTQTWQS